MVDDSTPSKLPIPSNTKEEEDRWKSSNLSQQDPVYNRDGLPVLHTLDRLRLGTSSRRRVIVRKVLYSKVLEGLSTPGMMMMIVFTTTMGMQEGMGMVAGKRPR